MRTVVRLTSWASSAVECTLTRLEALPAAGNYKPVAIQNQDNSKSITLGTKYTSSLEKHLRHRDKLPLLVYPLSEV